MDQHHPRAGDGGTDVTEPLLAAHLLSLALWAVAALLAALVRSRAQRRGDDAGALALHRSAMRLLLIEQAAFGVLLASGLLLVQASGLGLARERWLATKAGLVFSLLAPLEGMHAYVAHAWIARGLRESAPGAFARSLERGLGVEQMLRTLELLLFTPAVPLLVWLSVAKPF